MQPRKFGRLNMLRVADSFRNLQSSLAVEHQATDAELEQRFGTKIHWWKCPPHG